jgi:hypothetical protein
LIWYIIESTLPFNKELLKMLKKELKLVIKRALGVGSINNASLNVEF